MATKINLDTSQRVDITCRKGDTFSLRLTITNADDTVGFEAGHIFLFEVRNSDTGTLVQNGSSADFKHKVTAVADDATNKYIDFTVDASTMKTMPSGLYAYDIEQETNDSTPVVTTLIYGTVRVIEDVSETEA